MSPAPSPSHSRAIGMALIGFMLWTTGDTMMKYAVSLGAVRYELLPVSAIGGILSILAVTTLSGRLAALRPKRMRWLALLGLQAAFCVYCWLFAYPYLPLANFYAVLFTGPSLIAIMAVLFLKEKMDARKACAILAGFAGVVIAINPSRLLEEPGPALAYAVVLAGTVSTAVQMLVLRKIGRYETREAMALIPRVCMFACSLVVMAVLGIRPLALTPILLALCSGAIGGIGWLFMAQAYKGAPANVIAPFQYVQMLVAALAGYLVWNEVPGPHLIAGSLIIALSGIYLVSHLRRMARRQAALAENP